MREVYTDRQRICFLSHCRFYFILALLLLFVTHPLKASDFTWPLDSTQKQNTQQLQVETTPLFELAQLEDSADTYDPFTDYSDFENTSSEEADIYFFKHGRLLSLGGLFGMRVFTGRLGQHTRPAFLGGGFFSFFFNMRIAIQFHYLAGLHPFRALDIQVNDVNMERYIHEMSLTQIGLDVKYYLNTQNITQGLASFNPYFIAGASSISRKIKFVGSPAPFTDGKRIFGFHGGLGIEFPLTLNKVFFGFEARYQFVRFPVLLIDAQEFNIRSSNHGFQGFGILGVNF